MFKLDLEKAEEPEIKLPASVGSWKNQESVMMVAQDLKVTDNAEWYASNWLTW